MFPEYQQLIETLRQTDNHFASLYDKHTELDKEIEKITNNNISTINTPTEELTQLKRDKLQLKETILHLLKEAEQKEKAS